MTKHIPVLLEETIEGLYLKKGDIVVDATFGGGGHTREILKRILPARNASRNDAGGPDGTVIAFDTDASALNSFREMARNDDFLRQVLRKKNLILVHSNYSSLGNVLDEEEVEKVDALFADLGFSSDQIEESERGLSFLLSGPLDMRLNQETALTAEQIVNTFSFEEIERILRDFGEESESRRIARAIVVAREKKLLRTTDELRDVIEKVYPKGKRYKMKIHPATKTFQAIRIAVNQELKHLESFLTQAIERVKRGGRVAIITFHSGEDRVVKQFFKDQAKGCICPPGFPVCRCGNTPKVKILTKKPIIPGDEEIKKNSRSRSAKLRIVQKI